MKNSNVILFCCLFISLCFYNNSVSFSQEKQQKMKISEKNIQTNQQANNAGQKKHQALHQSGKFSQFVKKYIITDENPAFGDRQNAITVGMYGAFRNGFMNFSYPKKGVYSFDIHYVQPTKLFRVHGRISMGFFVFAGAGQFYHDRYQYMGMELYPEIIFGTKFFYVTGGIGFSYIIGNYSKLPSDRGSEMSDGNFVSTISIGHRFDKGVTVEIHIKHYSNADLGRVKAGNFVDSFGLQFGYAF